MSPAPQPFTYSTALAENLPAACDILQEAAAWLTGRGIPQWEPGDFTLAEVASWQVGGISLVAWEGSSPVGTVTVAFGDDPLWRSRPGGAGYIHKLAVRRRVAGMGVSRGLLRAAEAHIAAAGLPRARLDCWAGNSALRAFYAEAGYTLAGTVTERVGNATWECALFERPLTPRSPLPSLG